ncbi:restriction endonuclease subunit S [Flavobacterium psychrophilum]|uniref:restriction endonuclease subunit S n=1 Tax=Flavobacterium psychrophilum TaxID=96345 RepID=UPI001C8F97A5|nr:restriction endonuclease subunit S [Flavobacterium psychrophilum]EKT3972905.1 restriction endonuclease subunit S [Flavobacterium psychrophilum]EKT4499564.1 restriction endonuclease subunit S [Flavobacterium psychrophilum]EKT4519248.1 restriction endonuclease subunit S [Flavobacterium psychrophilum]EKT4535632.1 restriction endonuclease subunit S [Flavobacterium psychrophilum]EKT4569984.1 restriction endonuclease subunit S [Flavobacterium psychrophilum]
MQNKNYLKFTSLSKTMFWDFYSLSNKNSIFSNYPIVKLREVIIQRKGSITINDVEKYKRCRVQIHAKGVILRDEVLGKEIKTKKQQLCKKDDFLVAEIDAKVGGYGIVPYYLENAIVSSHYFLFEIDKTKLTHEFLGIVIKLYNFSKQIKSTGSTNYAAIRPYHVLEYKIPLPTLAEQNKIVASYNAKLQLAHRQEEQAKILERDIERYLFEELGIEKMIVKPFLKGVLNVFNFSEILDRWDYNKGSNSVFSILHQSKYPVKTLDEAFNFTNRSWNKKAHQEKTFTYVEMGGIDTGLGIVEVSNLEVSKAPSRATQTILSGDLIIGTTRPYLKKFAIVTDKNNENIASSAFQIIAPSKDYCLDYLLEYIKSEFGVKQFEYYMTGALYPAITSKDLRRVLIPIPPLEKQKQISHHINSLKEQIKELNVLSNLNKDVAIVEFEKKIFN